jgi:hypothetical protein
MTIRTYALYGGSKRLLICLTTIMTALAIAASVRFRVEFYKLVLIFLGGKFRAFFGQCGPLARNWLL